MKQIYFIALINLIFSQPIDFNHNGEIRQYFLHQPESILDNTPLIFALHGYGGGPNWMINNTGLNDIADQNGFIVCYPKGTTDSWGNRFWNVGYDFHENINIDDVDFLSSLAIYLQTQYGYSSENTFVTGMSNGGDMSYMLACQTNSLFKAIAPVAGSMMENIYNTCDSPPIPVFEIHGTNDNITLWEGDLDNNDGWGAYLSTEAGISFWKNLNECQNNQYNILEDLDLIHHKYFNCNNNTEVWLYEVTDGGHDWPSYSSQAIWTFFNQFISIEQDINQDGVINVLDVIQIINIILSSTDSADINNDGVTNILDVVELINTILNN